MNTLKNNLLISCPHMNDAIFGKSVIYICEHNSNGAMGLIINKSINNISLESLKNLERISNDQLKNIKIYYGGPIMVEKIIALHTNELETENTIPINNKISILSGENVISDIEKNIKMKYKLFWGHSAWSPGQLEREIENGDWLLQSSKIDLLFNISSEKIWKSATRSLRINIGGSA